MCLLIFIDAYSHLIYLHSINPKSDKLRKASIYAGVAQLIEYRSCNPNVVCLIPIVSSKHDHQASDSGATRWSSA